MKSKALQNLILGLMFVFVPSAAFAAAGDAGLQVGVSESHLILLGLLFVAIVSTAARKPSQPRIQASLDQTSFT